MEGFLPIFFLLVVLKIPVFAALWLVWWAIRAQPEAEEAGDGDDGFRRWDAEPRGPRWPRRGGPHGSEARPLPDCPPGGRSRAQPAPVRARITRAHKSGSS